MVLMAVSQTIGCEEESDRERVVRRVGYRVRARAVHGSYSWSLQLAVGLVFASNTRTVPARGLFLAQWVANVILSSTP